MKDAVVVFNGWGMDGHAMAHLYDGRDVLLIAPETPITMISAAIDEWGERVVNVVAWSMGVWAANRFFGARQSNLMINKAIAINGTPPGIDDDYAIPWHVFKHMARSFNQQQRTKLYRRIFSMPAWRDDDYSAFLPQRDISDQHRALMDLLRACSSASPDYQHWTHAWVSVEDPIVPTQQQYRYWQSRDVVLQTKIGAHHLLRSWSSWADFFDQCR